MVYGDFDGPGRRKTNPIQTQYTGRWPEIRSTKL